MTDKRRFTRALAWVGVAGVLLPVVAPVVFSLIRAVQRGGWRFDYLMPAELAPVAGVGALLLLWAAIRAHAYRGAVAWGIAAAVAGLAGGSLIAIWSGIASGEVPIEEARWAQVLVTALVVGVYGVALVELGAAGVALARELAPHDDAGAHPAAG